MGIGRKATDQRTPCRKFLATPLPSYNHRGYICGSWASCSSSSSSRKYHWWQNCVLDVRQTKCAWSRSLTFCGTLCWLLMRSKDHIAHSVKEFRNSRPTFTKVTSECRVAYWLIVYSIPSFYLRQRGPYRSQTIQTLELNKKTEKTENVQKER